jgi:ABC-type bacteriocin/lantibiotic exporter with double-glycine peptidase domain
MKTKQYYPHALSSLTITLLENRVEVIEKSPWTYVRREIPFNKISTNYSLVKNGEVVLSNIGWLGFSVIILVFILAVLFPFFLKIATIIYIPIIIVSVSSLVLRPFFKRTYKTFYNLNEKEAFFSVEIKSGKKKNECEKFVEELLYKIESSAPETIKEAEGSGAL